MQECPHPPPPRMHMHTKYVVHPTQLQRLRAKTVHWGMGWARTNTHTHTHTCRPQLLSAHPFPFGMPCAEHGIPDWGGGREEGPSRVCSRKKSCVWLRHSPQAHRQESRSGFSAWAAMGPYGRDMGHGGPVKGPGQGQIARWAFGMQCSQSLASWRTGLSGQGSALLCLFALLACRPCLVADG